MVKYPGVSPYYLSRLRKSLGLPKFKPGPKLGVRWVQGLNSKSNLSGEEYELMIRLLKEFGQSYQQIANIVGKSHQAVQQYIRVKCSKTGKCELCGRRSKSLHGHHLSYRKNSKYKLLCMGCHVRVHRQ